MSQRVVDQFAENSGVGLVQPSGYVGESSPYLHADKWVSVLDYNGMVARPVVGGRESIVSVKLTSPSTGTVVDRAYEIAQNLFAHVQWLATMDVEDIVISEPISRRLSLRVVKKRELPPLIIKDDF